MPTTSQEADGVHALQATHSANVAGVVGMVGMVGMVKVKSASRRNIDLTAVILAGFIFDIFANSSSSYAQEIEIPQQAT